MHLFASRKDIGDATFTVTDGRCIGETDFTTPADRFPEVDCTPEEPATGVGQPSDDYETTVLADEPTSYWRFEEESGDETMSADGQTAEPMNDVVLGQPGFIDGSRSALLVEAVAEDVGGTDVGGGSTFLISSLTATSPSRPGTGSAASSSGFRTRSLARAATALI